MMRLNEWCGVEQVRIARFQLWWLDKHDIDPDNFPLDMEPGEWDEQYHIWEG
jgi:hypothetical protein